MADTEGLSTPGPYRDGRIHVLSSRCGSCVFHAGNLMRLQPGRLRDLVEGNLADDSALHCHSTLYRPDVEPSICRGFYDAYAAQVFPLRLAAALDLITEVDPPEKEI